MGKFVLPKNTMARLVELFTDGSLTEGWMGFLSDQKTPVVMVNKGEELEPDEFVTVTFGAGSPGQYLTPDFDGGFTFDDLPEVPQINFATSSNFIEGDPGLVLASDVVWEAAVPVSQSTSGTVSLDFSTFINREITASGNITFGTTTNTKPGQSGLIEFVHNGAARTLTVNSTYWTTPGGAPLVLSTTSGARDLLAYSILRSGKVFLTVAALGV